MIPLFLTMQMINMTKAEVYAIPLGAFLLIWDRSGQLIKTLLNKYMEDLKSKAMYKVRIELKTRFGLDSIVYLYSCLFKILGISYEASYFSTNRKPVNDVHVSRIGQPTLPLYYFPFFFSSTAIGFGFPPQTSSLGRMNSSLISSVTAALRSWNPFT